MYGVGWYNICGFFDLNVNFDFICYVNLFNVGSCVVGVEEGGRLEYVIDWKCYFDFCVIVVVFVGYNVGIVCDGICVNLLMNIILRIWVFELNWFFFFEFCVCYVVLVVIIGGWIVNF